MKTIVVDGFEAHHVSMALHVYHSEHMTRVMDLRRPAFTSWSRRSTSAAVQAAQLACLRFCITTNRAPDRPGARLKNKRAIFSRTQQPSAKLGFEGRAARI
jgi:hypothetical protein